MSLDFTVTVANIDGGSATVASPDHQLFQIPQSLLPGDLVPGSMLRFVVETDDNQELNRRQEIFKLIDDIAVYIRSKSTSAPAPQIPISGKKSRRGSIDIIN